MATFPQIFVSSGGPDKDFVDPLVARLEAFGFRPIFHYRNSMPPGANLKQTVMDKIAAADIAVICFSDLTADREWIIAEIAWCEEALRRKELQQMIPVRLGSEVGKTIPALLSDKNVIDFNGSEEAVYALAEKIASLSRTIPQVLPAALFAMTKDQADDTLVSLPKEEKGIEDLCRRLATKWAATPQQVLQQLGNFDRFCRELCVPLGMDAPPALLKRLAKRYGTRAEDFRPFEDEITVVELVYARLNSINEKRIRKGRPPLFLRWLHDAFAAGGETELEANELWESGQSLTIIDSISIWCNAVDRVVKGKELSRSSLLWIPPYSQQTASLTAALNAALLQTMGVATQFRKAEKDFSRLVSLAVVNSAAFSGWIHRALQTADEQTASEAAVSEVEQAFGSDEERRGNEGANLRTPSISPQHFYGGPR